MAPIIEDADFQIYKSIENNTHLMEIAENVVVSLGSKLRSRERLLDRLRE